MKNQEITHLISQMQKNANKTARTCLYMGCKESSIISHLLQKRGIISSIAEQQHVIEISLNAFKKDFFHFRSVGIGEALSYPGFCNKHDTELFKEIESGILDYEAYRTHLLLSYRALMIEKRKKEINIDWYTRIRRSRLVYPELDATTKMKIEESLAGEIEGIQDQQFYEEYFLTNISDVSLRDFEFTYFELPKIEICSSAVFTYETSGEIAINNLLHRNNIDDPLTQIYFHLLPFSDKSVVIMGCLKGKISKCREFIHGFDCGESNQSLKKISDLLISQVENWVCSPTFYRNNCKKREIEINALVRLSMKHQDERRTLNFSLFEEPQ